MLPFRVTPAPRVHTRLFESLMNNHRGRGNRGDAIGPGRTWRGHGGSDPNTFDSGPRTHGYRSRGRR
ncbi:hypothetical protein HSEST_1179 [Halapricum desulfuricans]|uniref:Uncharacterized protein n=1 Tax=Halapricum desulfuricans TaxID=2841257 RepID=A0A897NPK1_9EURY|nr:hypothetical protein HSEST_1179 [Halapricum desulfuricans]